MIAGRIIMLSRIKNALINFHSSLLPEELYSEKRKKVLFYISFYLILISTFFTVFSQLPIFTARKITQLFQLGWILTLIPLVMLDYKRVLKYLFLSLCLIAPFIIYGLLSFAFGVRSILYDGSLYALLCLYLFIVFGTFSKYKNKITTKSIFFAFLLSSIFYAGVVFFTKLKGYDLENQIYAFGDKNSAGPIFLSAAVVGFYIFNKRSILSIIAKWAIFIFFVIIIALSKNRTMLITLPIIFFVLLFYDVNKPFVSVLSLLGFIALLIILFAVPYLRETIIVKILFNNKTDVDSIFSGRITNIVENMQAFKPVLGSGGSYFDCMILSFLCSYGVLGFLALLPLLIFPFFILCYFNSKRIEKSLKSVIIDFVVIFVFSSLLEGYGYFGTGAKVFVFWFLVGNYSNEVFSSLRNTSAITKYKRISNRFASISSISLTRVIQFILLGASVAMIAITTITTFVGKTIVDRLPASNKIAEYVEVKDMQIDSPVSSMCVGQRITYNIKSNPINAEDKTVYWSTGWIKDPNISVDGYTGEVTANRPGSALLHINRFRVGPNGVYIQFSVKNVEEYTFDKTYISTNEFKKSFNYTSDEKIELDVYCTSKIYYDNYYLPDQSIIEFVSTNSSVAYVENGLIKANSPGECDIYAVIHGKEDKQSLNKITIKVNDAPFTPTTSIDLNSEQSWYQNQKYEIKPTFNDGASDKNFKIQVSGLNYSIENNFVTFLSHGLGTLKVISDNDSSIYKSYDINVLENNPTHFECKIKRMLIGETKDAKQLGLSLVFSNGYKKTLTEDDILFDPFDFANRAWSDRSGFVKGRTTVKAVVSGAIKLNYVSKINPDVKGHFNIISSVYTQEQYDNITSGVGQIAITFVLIISLLFSIFVSFKKNWVLLLTLCSASVVFVLVELMLFGISNYFIISLTMIIISLLILSTLRICVKKKFPVLFFEEPLDVSCKRSSSVISNPNFEQIKI